MKMKTNQSDVLNLEPETKEMVTSEVGAKAKSVITE